MLDVKTASERVAQLLLADPRRPFLLRSLVRIAGQDQHPSTGHEQTVVDVYDGGLVLLSQRVVTATVEQEAERRTENRELQDICGDKLALHPRVSGALLCEVDRGGSDVRAGHFEAVLGEVHAVRSRSAACLKHTRRSDAVLVENAYELVRRVAGIPRCIMRLVTRIPVHFHGE